MKEQYSDFLFEKGYVLQDKIGEGMEGQVYQAHAAHDASKKYAIKIQEKFTSGEVLLRLLDHPNIVKFHEKLIHPELLTNCIVLDYVQGRTLLDFISDERPSLPQLKAVMLQICKAVNYMHQNEIVHRDLKLENILITDKGQVKLIDSAWRSICGHKARLYFAAVWITSLLNCFRVIISEWTQQSKRLLSRNATFGLWESFSSLCLWVISPSEETAPPPLSVPFYSTSCLLPLSPKPNFPLN